VIAIGDYDIIHLKVNVNWRS